MLKHCSTYILRNLRPILHRKCRVPSFVRVTPIRCLSTGSFLGLLFYNAAAKSNHDVEESIDSEKMQGNLKELYFVVLFIIFSNNFNQTIIF